MTDEEFLFAHTEYYITTQYGKPEHGQIALNLKYGLGMVHGSLLRAFLTINRFWRSWHAKEI